MSLKQQRVIKNIILILFLLFATTTIYADINYECVIMQMVDNNKVTYNRLDKTKPAPFAKTAITKRKNLLYDGTFYYQYYKSQNGTNFYINEPFKMMIGMSSKPIKKIKDLDIYSLVIFKDTGKMTFMCGEKYTNSTTHIKSKKDLNINTIESEDLLKMFALDKSIGYNMYSWRTGTGQNSPIKWLYSGIKTTPQGSKYSYERKGEVYVTNNGKITHTILEKKIVNGKWKISLLGARGGYFVVEINSGVFTEPPPKLKLEKKYILKERHCEESASENTSMYLIAFPGKKPLWLYEVFSSGSAGGSYWYTILYDDEPKCGI